MAAKAKPKPKPAGNPSADGRRMRVADLPPDQQAALAYPSEFCKRLLKMPLYPIQGQVMDSVAECKGGKPTTFRTANESGKTSHVVAGLILWHLAVFPKGQVISTAGVWRQVTQQLVPHLKRFRSQFPKWTFNATSIGINGIDRYCGFSTNDAGKFEGYHGNPEEPLLMIVDEAKTVKDDIFAAVERCRPQRLLLCSTPGAAEREFWRSHNSRREFYHCFKLPADQCPHLWEDPQRRQMIDAQIAKWGRDHELIQSMVFAEFMDAAEDSIVSYSEIDDCMAEPPGFNQSSEIHAFCDFAKGGDENVLAVRRGNRVTIADAWREKDSMKAVGRFVTLFQREGLKPHEIEGDADGAGGVMIDALREAGWPILEFHGGSSPIESPRCKNRVSEIWHEGAASIRNRGVILPFDEEMRGQMASRKKKYDRGGKLWVEDKEDMRKRGIPSPDRADAVFGAMGPLPMTESFNLIHTDEPAPWLESMEVEAGVLAGADAGW